MEKTQNAKSNQQNGSSEILEKTLVGKKTQELDPNNPITNKNKQEHQRDQKQDHNSNAMPDKKHVEVKEMKEEKSVVGKQNTEKENS